MSSLPQGASAAYYRYLERTELELYTRLEKGLAALERAQAEGKQQFDSWFATWKKLLKQYEQTVDLKKDLIK
jgi:hypothetical protein